MVARLTGFVVLMMVTCANGQQFSTHFRKIEHITRPHFRNSDKILKDSEGYLWFSTDNALVKYDASNVIRYAGQELLGKDTERPVPQILFEDSLKNLLTITSQGKVLRYNRLKDRFHQVNDSSTLLGNTARSLVAEGNGKYWVSHMGEGLAMVDLKKKSIKWYKHDPSNPQSLRDNYVTALTRDKRGRLWVGTTSGLFHYNEATDDFEFKELKNHNPNDTYRYRVIRSLAYDSLSDRLFIGTYGGLHVYDLLNDTQEHLIHNPNNAYSLSINSIFQVLYDQRYNGLWICTYGGGLNFYDLSTRRFQRWYHDPADAKSIGSDNVVGIYLDREGLLWVVTAEAGLYVLNTNPEIFHRIVHQSKNPNSISPGLPRAVYAESDSVIWIGFNGTGLNRMNLHTGHTIRYKHDPSNPGSIVHNAIIDIDGDKYGRIWVGLEGGGLAVYDYNKDAFEQLRYQHGKVGILNDAISALLVDDDLVWITAFRAPLTVYNMQTRQFRHFNADSLFQLGISFHEVRRIRKFDNSIWFETHLGTVVFDKQSQTFQTIARGQDKVYTVFVNDNSEAFSYTPQEVQFLLTGNQVHAAEYRPGDSLRTRLIYDGAHHPYRFTDLVMDRNRVLWITTEEDIVSYNTQTQEERVFSSDQGLDVINLSFRLATDRQGRIYLKSDKGLFWFDPLMLDEKAEDHFSIKFTSLKIFNQEVAVGPDSTEKQNRLNQHIAYTSRFTLKPFENFFSLAFTALHFENPSQVRYRYRLAGFNEDWVEIGTTNFVSFTSLDPGLYTLEIIATTDPQKWGSNRASIQIEVLPPFWRTWWFISAAVVVFICSLYGIYYYKVNQKIQLERLRTKIASDLHDDIGSNLTRLSIYSELLGNGVAEQEKNSYLSNIRDISREVVTTMSDIVWSIDSRSDTLGDLILRMKDFAAQLLSPKQIEFQFHTVGIDEKRLLSPQLKQGIYLVYKESLHNIVKHAQASHVGIAISYSTAGFSMQITDNGSGFDVGQASKGNGLRSMQRRASDIGARFTITGNQGTTIALERESLA